MLAGREQLEDASPHRIAQHVEGVHQAPVYAAVVRDVAAAAVAASAPEAR
jgi:hypothetical protein